MSFSKKVGIIFLFVLSHFWVNAQITTTELTYTPSINACETGNFKIHVEKNTGNFVSTDSVELAITLPTGISLTNYNLINSTATSTLNSTTLKVKNISGNAFDLEYTIKPGCNYININTTNLLTNTITYSYNAITVDNLVSSAYNISSAWLVFDAAGSRNLDYDLGKFGVPIERVFKYTNTSNVVFNGDFLFTDTTEQIAPNAGVTFSDIVLSYPVSGVEVQKIVTDTSVLYKVRITGIGVGDSIVFKETVNLVKCPTGSIDNSITRFRADYGCTGGTLCRSITHPSYITSTAFDPNDRPAIKTRLLTPGYLKCAGQNQERLYRIVNTGSGNASGLQLTFSATGNNNNATAIDTSISNIEIFTKSGLIEIPVPFVKTSNAVISYNILAIYQTTGIIAAGDTIFVRFYEIRKCIDSTEYDTYFNQPIEMYGQAPVFQFLHPCFPSVNYYMDDTYGWRTWEQTFNLKQNFENLSGSINDDDEVWYEIKNETTLYLGRDPSYYGFIFHMDSAAIKVEVDLESGLGLVGDSLLLYSANGSVETIIYPYQITYTVGPGGIGTGDKAVAYFRFPASFYNNLTGISSGGSVCTGTNAFRSFANNFKVKFKVKAYCEYSINGGFANMNQKFYFIPNVYCSPNCALPLSSVGDKINIHCPGCILPGWNLFRFDINRTNFGSADNNNNNYPDTYPSSPANTALAQVKHIMVGDTINCIIKGFTSDGENLLFNNIGFDYDEGQLTLQSPLMVDLKFIGATGIFTNEFGNTASFTIPASEGIYYTNGFAINIGINKLVSYGLPLSFITKFWNNHHITIEPKFVVKNNLNHGTGGDPYYSVEQINAFINMSGTPFTGIQNKPDAGEIPIDTIIAMTTTERADLMYWCTGFEGRTVAIGADFKYFQNVSNFYNDINPCYKTINAFAYTDVGQVFSGGYSDQGGTQKAWNSFSYELRDLWMLDSITINYPSQYYDIDRIEFKNTQLTSDSLTNQTLYNSNVYYNAHLYNYTANINDAVYGASNVTIYPARNFSQITKSYNTTFTAYDETKRYRMYVVLRMKDCQTIPNIINVANQYPITSYWSNFPGALTGDTVLQYNLPAGSYFDNPSATLNTQVLPVQQNVGGTDLSWNMNVEVNVTGNDPYTNAAINERAENSFVYFVSPSGSINIDNVLRNNVAVSVVDTIDGLPLYGLGTLGGNWGYYISAALKVNASYNCSDITSTDSLLVITGWNCYGYPATIAEACYKDTNVIYIQPENPGLQAALVSEDTVNACDNISYQLELKATGLGDVQGIEARVILPTGGELTYSTGSGSLAYNNQTVLIEPYADSLGLVWKLDSVGIMALFNGFKPSAYLNFEVKSGCGFNNEDVKMEITAQNYCGKLIGPIVIARRPTVIEGLPELDEISLSYNQSSFKACSDTATINFTVKNIGSETTTGNNTLAIQLPQGIQYAGGANYSSVNQNTYAFAIPQNIASGATTDITLQVTNSQPIDCGQLPLSVQISTSQSYYCDTTLCTLTENINDTLLHINISKPNIQLSSIEVNGICKKTQKNVIVSVSNISNTDASNTLVSLYCYRNNTIGCNLGSTTLATLQGGTTTNITIGYNSCDTCSTVIAIVSANDNCICQSDSVVGTVNCTSVCDKPIVTCTDTTINYNQIACGSFILPQPHVISDCEIVSISNNYTGGAFPVGTTQVIWTVINEQGDTSTCAQNVTYLPATMSSSYTIIGIENVELYPTNLVQTGSVGVTSTNGTAYLQNYTTVNGTGATVQAANIVTFPNTVVSTALNSPAPIVLPAFEYNTAGAGPDVNVPVNGTVTLTGTTYGTISLNKGAKVIFTNSAGIVNVYAIKVNNKMAGSSTVIQFSQCTKVRVKTRVDMGPNCTINPTGKEVIFYVEGSNSSKNDNQPATDIGPNSIVNANFYVPFGRFYAHAGSNTVKAQMNGTFIAKWITGAPDIIWNWRPECSNAVTCTSTTLKAEKIADNPLINDNAITEKTVKLYPNPSTGIIHLDYTLAENEAGRVELYNVEGQKVSEYVLDKTANTLEMNESKLTNGVYWYKLLINEQAVKTDKLVIIK